MEIVFIIFIGKELVRVKTKDQKQKDDRDNEIKKLRKKLAELHEKVDGLVDQAANRPKDLSFNSSRRFCKTFQSAGAYCSHANYNKWVASGGKLLLTREDDIEATAAPTYGKWHRKGWSHVSDSASYTSNSRRGRR